MNGYRIELAEVEIALSTFEAVEQAVVVVRGGQLVAYVKAVSGEELSPPRIQQLRAHAAKTLTSYMMPK